jgi:hypothetical protein
MFVKPPELRAYSGYFLGLRRLLSHRLSLEESRKTVIGLLEKRDARFLELIARIWGNPDSPYRKLMDAAGISKAEIEESVSSEGTDETLRFLANKGVYVTVDEFKGRSTCIRNGVTCSFHGRDFDNTYGAGFSAMTGGSRSAGTHVFIDFDHRR